MTKLGWYPAARAYAKQFYKMPTGTPRQILRYITDTEQLSKRLSLSVIAVMDIQEITITAMELRIYDALIQQLRESVNNYVPPPF